MGFDRGLLSMKRTGGLETDCEPDAETVSKYALTRA